MLAFFVWLVRQVLRITSLYRGISYGIRSVVGVAAVLVTW